jgi:Gas vesicle synthesis protein GvpL/GvpF
VTRGANATSTYVYAVVRGALPEDFAVPGAGADPAAVRTLEGGGLTAVVSDVPEGWAAAGRADLEAHDRVLSALIPHVTVIPMRFGVVLDSDEAVRDRLLERHSAELEDLLERLNGRVQMSVKAYYVEEALLRAVLERRPDLKRRSQALEGRPAEASRDERIALGREVAAEVEEQRAHDEHTVAEPLAAVAVEARVDPPASDRQVASVQLLVEVARRPELDAVVQRLDREHGDRITFRYVGPLPPYSFADLTLAGEAA